jgi:hypothetical protein
MTEVSALLDEPKRRLGSQHLDITEGATMKAHVIRKDLTVAVTGASRDIGHEIDKELTKCGVALGINADEYR